MYSFVKQILPGSFWKLICSLKQAFKTISFVLDFKLFETIPTPSFQFGGQKGSTVTSLVFSHKSWERAIFCTGNAGIALTSKQY